MEKDFTDRVQEYQRIFKVKVAQTEAPGLYKYYSTQRPVDIGTFPKPPHNAPDEVVNYDQRIPVEDGTFLAWGHLTYTKPLIMNCAPPPISLSYPGTTATGSARLPNN